MAAAQQAAPGGSEVTTKWVQARPEHTEVFLCPSARVSVGTARLRPAVL